MEVATDSVVAGCERRAGEWCRRRMGFRRLGEAGQTAWWRVRGGGGRGTEYLTARARILSRSDVAAAVCVVGKGAASTVLPAVERVRGEGGRRRKKEIKKKNKKEKKKGRR